MGVKKYSTLLKCSRASASLSIVKHVYHHGLSTWGASLPIWLQLYFRYCVLIGHAMYIACADSCVKDSLHTYAKLTSEETHPLKIERTLTLLVGDQSHLLFWAGT